MRRPTTQHAPGIGGGYLGLTLCFEYDTSRIGYDRARAEQKTMRLSAISCEACIKVLVTYPHLYNTWRAIDGASYAEAKQTHEAIAVAFAEETQARAVFRLPQSGQVEEDKLKEAREFSGLPHSEWGGKSGRGD
jgi:hypothetical protein